MSIKSTIPIGVLPGGPPAPEEYYAFPLTSAQRSMWPEGFRPQSDPRYNGAFRMNLEGDVDVALLQRSLRAIAQRQESLRISFREEAAATGNCAANGSGLQQVIAPDCSLMVDVIDLRSFAEADRAAMLDDRSTKEAARPFDLMQGPPIRVKLLRLLDRHSVLTITVHQAICDGWSIGLLMEELAVVYDAFAQQKPSRLAPLGFQFGDYVTWEQQNAASGAVRSQLHYWRQKLDGCPQTAVAPDIGGPLAWAEAGIVSQLLPRSLTDRLRDYGTSENATFFVVTMAACMVLLSRYTGQQEIALRTPLAGRDRVELEPIIGQFTNQVVVRATADRDLTFGRFLESVKESVWEALANQDAPFERVLRFIAAPVQPVKDAFAINFVCQREYGRNGPSTFEFDGIKMTTLPSKSQGALYDLNFFLVEREAGWRLSLEYRTGLYGRATADSLLRHFQEILNQIADKPNRTLAEIELSPTEALTRRTNTNATLSTTSESPAEQDLVSDEIVEMPCSLAQERFWTLSQLDPANPAFHVPLILKISGPLSAALLKKSLQLLVDRHESLRTAFRDRDGELLQAIHSAYPVSLEAIKITGAGKSERELNLAAAIEKEIRKRFDLSAPPLFRTTLCEMDDEEHVFVMTLHHILADAASAQVIQQELWATYEILAAGETHDLAPLDIQYGDFSVWQRENLDSDEMKVHLDFWKEQLSGDLKTLEFPTDHPPAYRPTSKGAVETLLLPEELTQAAKQFAKANDVTLYVLTLACFAAMLSLASESEDVIVGSPVLNRRRETEWLIGPFAGPVALRLNSAGNPTFRELVLTSRDRTLEALDHAELPFEMLLRNLTLKTQNERRPLFQFYFLCQTAFVQSRKVGPLAIAPLPSVSVGTPFEMQLAIIERSEGLRAELEYNADLFDQSTVIRWLAYYQELLHIAVSAPERRLNDLPAPPCRSGPSQIQHASSKNPDEEKTADRPYVAPRDLVEEMVAQIWEGVLGIPSISVDSNFFDLGGSSLLILKLVPRINAAFDLVLPVPTIFKAPTIEMMANVLRKRHTIEKQVVLPLHPSGSRPPLFMIHSYHLYRALPAALGADQPFYGVMELELADRHAPYTLKHQVENYVQHIRKVQPEGPYYIAGFCFFGLLAFEVSAQLEALGAKVAFLGLIDSYCPEYWSHQHSGAPQPARAGSRLMPRSSAPLWHHLRKTGEMKLSSRLAAHGNFILAKLRNQGLSLLLEARVALYTRFIRRGTQLPSWLKDPALVTRVGVRRHSPAKIASKIYLFPAEDVPLEADFDRTLGWGALTSGEVRLTWIPGDHADMFKEKNVASLAQSIRSAMDEAVVAKL